MGSMRLLPCMVDVLSFTTNRASLFQQTRFDIAISLDTESAIDGEQLKSDNLERFAKVIDLEMALVIPNLHQRSLVEADEARPAPFLFLVDVCFQHVNR